MMKKMKLATILRKDEGLSLAEILVSVGLTGLLALGCTQLALASFTSASYTEAIAMKSVDSGNANRMVTTDMESASGFLVPSKSGALPSTSQCTTSSSNSVRPLVTLAYANGNMVGYEVRNSADSGSLWRIACPTAGNPTGTEQLVRKNLPIATSTHWDAAVLCATYPAGGSLTSARCDEDSMLTSLVTNPGIVFTIPASNPAVKASTPVQIIIAARTLA
ncbi:MAG: hypothetical protein WCQ06_04200 [Actinomycetes bacterium]